MPLELDFKSSGIPRIILILFLIDIGLCAAYVLEILMGQPFWKLTTLLGLHREDSLSAWYSSTQLFCLFLVAAFYSYIQITRHGKPIHLILLPAIFLLWSIDESVELHEWLGSKTDALLPGGTREGIWFDRTGIWMFVVGLPFLAFFVLYLFSIRRHFFSELPAAFNKLILGMVIMFTGALGFESLVNFVHEDFRFIVIAIEEGMEMVGVTVMLWAVYDITVTHLARNGVVIQDGSSP